MTPASGAQADVELRVPAESAYVSVLRTTTAGLAARLDFTMDDIEDLRIAVGEASTLVLEQAAGDDLSVRFWLEPGALTVEVAASVAGATPPAPDSFAWTVLTSLASQAEVTSGDGELGIRLTMHSTAL